MRPVGNTAREFLELVATLALLAIALPLLYLLSLFLRRPRLDPMTGKGDTPRPLSVPPEVLEANWQATFPPTPAQPPAQPLDTLGDPEE